MLDWSIRVTGGAVGRPAVARFCNDRGPGRRRGFTLVELLVVIGIIALLMSILLPTLARVREQANATACLSNIRQLATAFVGYTADSRGKLPQSGMQGQPSGWIYWEPTRKVQDSPIAPYMGGLNSTAALVCPTDDPENNRPGAYATGAFKFSYTFNRFFTTDGAWNGVQNLAQVRNASQKIVFVEEDERTVNDGRWEPHLGNYFTLYPVGEKGVDLLAIRHDRKRKEPDVPNTAGWGWIPNPERYGNAAFADGHAESVYRSQAHAKEYFDPRL